jgi:large conductance mechanosensitive channel
MPVTLSEIRNPRSTFEEFKAFLIKQNVLALAIAVVVGAALNSVVQGLVDDFIMPLVGVAMPAGAWREYTTPGPVAFKVGHFLSVLLNFLIVGFVAWRITKFFIKPEPAAAAPSTKTCQYCRMSIDAAATRCSHCTSQL